MQFIRCTGKLLKEMGLKESVLNKNEPPFSCLGSWHANLIHIDRKKCILFTNDKTLFKFIVVNAARSDIIKLDVIFKRYIRCVLADEGLGVDVTEKIMDEYKEMAFAKTNSKSVLGSMNDLAFNYKHRIQAEGGVNSPSVPGIIRTMNRMPMGAIKYLYPVEVSKAMYGK